MKTPKLALIAGVAVGLAAGGPAWAGAKLKIDDDSYIDLGARVQSQIIQQEVDLDGDGSWDDDTDFKVRRARFRLNLVVNEYVSAFIQTDASDDAGGTGSDMRVIDSYVLLKYNNWLQLFSGEHMAPSSRQALTSSGALLAIDRPGLTYKNLSWGLRSLDRFANGTIAQTSDNKSADNAVRDVGATVFGSGSFSDTMHLKYYAGAYDGVQDATTTDDDNLRWAGRVQFNMFDAEPGYFNSATYLGKKKTLGFGLSYETQDEIQDATGGGTGDYEYFEVDAFMEWPVGDGAFTAEAAYSDLDLDDATTQARQAQGDGWYLQAGWLFGKWQPWAEYETWDSDSPTGDFGSYDLWRLGVSYYFKGHNAAVKVGYEEASLDENYSGTTEDSRGTFVVGFYATY